MINVPGKTVASHFFAMQQKYFSRLAWSLHIQAGSVTQKPSSKAWNRQSFWGARYCVSLVVPLVNEVKSVRATHGTLRVAILCLLVVLLRGCSDETGGENAEEQGRGKTGHGVNYVLLISRLRVMTAK